ncbi:hypothetical protein FUAX_29910 [Fulvitalea axinellae]|uniref:Uncharacterized protein n=1 Tax=Fulvitalea axinellae TaxID=1182444 RepID=A0AAU9CEG8_9BACT|nr:hypothetical protein FUAX_29910 [Fulvitalea axinellae]
MKKHILVLGILTASLAVCESVYDSVQTLVKKQVKITIESKAKVYQYLM